MQHLKTPPAADELDIRELLRPEAFTHSVDRIELRETHISWVVRTGPFAYKIKKPVQLDFIDAAPSCTWSPTGPTPGSPCRTAPRSS